MSFTNFCTYSDYYLNTRKLTVIVVPGEILPVNEEVVVLVQLPELAVDHVEVLVAEEFRHLNTNLD